MTSAQLNMSEPAVSKHVRVLVDAALVSKAAANDTLAGADGLYWYKGGLVGIQTSPSLRRVMRWKLWGDGRRVVASETLERGTELVADPTTGAILDDKFY